MDTQNTKPEILKALQIIKPKRIGQIKKGDKKPASEINKRKFIKAYLESGNATESYIKVFKTTRKIAQGNSSNFLKKIDITDLMEEAGITDKQLIATTLEGLKADKPFGKDAFIYPDHATRHNYLETALKLKKRLTNSKEDNNTMVGLNIIINK